MLTEKEKSNLLKKTANAISNNKPIGEIKVLLCALVGAGINFNTSFRYYEDINKLGVEYEYTLLHLAAESGDFKVVKELLEHGADTRAKLKFIGKDILRNGERSYNQTPLDIAIEKVQNTFFKKTAKYSNASDHYNVIKLISDHDKSKRNNHIACASIITIACIGASLAISNLWMVGCAWVVGLLYIGMCSCQAYQYQQTLNKITPEIRTELKEINLEQQKPELNLD